MSLNKPRLARELRDSPGWKTLVAPDIAMFRKNAEDSLLTKQLSLEEAAAARAVRDAMMLLTDKLDSLANSGIEDGTSHA